VNERTSSLGELIRDHRRIALDANVLIYLLDADETIGPRAGALLDSMEGAGTDAYFATIGHVEVLAGPARADDSVTFERTVEEIDSVGLHFVPLTREIAADAAWLRGRDRMRLADAIHLASARLVGATAFVTNDRRIRSIPRLDVVYLDDLIA
jgi:predicted nucleic acid-binding protein